MTITQGYLENPVFKLVSETAGELGVRAFVIGGYVRDCFLGRPNKDIDIVVEMPGRAKQAKQETTVACGRGLNWRRPLRPRRMRG